MIVHDDKSRLYWRLAAVEDLIERKDGLVRAALIRMSNYNTTSKCTALVTAHENRQIYTIISALSLTCSAPLP